MKAAVQVGRELPGLLIEDERRRIVEERLREQSAAEAEDLVRRHERARHDRRAVDVAGGQVGSWMSAPAPIGP
ncbi:hypothetical protein [Streptomyces sp. PsTaAH-124]|uniref:hypothetical protein n=1 Tax=Streptomyces sp. PsTaAH-124 TaxID=1157638 RepID=UPI000361DAB6|nr:hypothetical protein [Streptomyces sp. PsTaAH-124]